MSLAYDEMKIQKGLVFRRSTNELVGFADLDLWESNVNDGENYRDALATHATQFLSRLWTAGARSTHPWLIFTHGTINKAKTS